MSKSNSIYLGYHSIEAEFVVRLATELRNAGFPVWLDRLDLNETEDWYTALQKAIHQSSAVLTILSPDYMSSQFGQYELKYAYDNGRKILPVLYRVVNAAQWNPAVDYRNNIDFTESQDETSYKESFAKLCDLIKTSLPNLKVTPVDPERQQLNNLLCEIEIHKASLEYVDISYQSQSKRTKTTVMRPRPRIQSAWGLEGRFRILNDESKEVTNIYNAVNTYSRLILVGDTGSGKSTVIRRLIQDAIQLLRQSRQDEAFPFLVDATQWRDGQTFEEFLLETWQYATNPIDMLQLGRVTLYMDNVEAVADKPEKIKTLKSWLHGNQQPRNLILACDSQFYDKLELGLSTVLVEKIEPSAIDGFVNQVLGKELSGHFWGRLYPFPEQPSPYEWTIQTPLLLQMLVYVYQHSPSADLPTSIGGLLHRVLELRWQREQILDNPDWFPIEDIALPLSQLAYEMVDAGRQNLLSKERVQSILTNHRLVNALVSAKILWKSPKGQVGFVHKMFVHYFAGLYLQREGYNHALQRPDFDEDGTLKPLIWDDTIPILSGIVDDPNTFVRSIADVNAYLAVRCIEAGNHISEDSQRMVLNRLIYFASVEEVKARASTLQTLYRIGSGKVTQLFLEAMREGEWHIRKATATLFESMTTSLSRELRQTLRNWGWHEDHRVVSALRQIGDEATSALLKLLKDEDWAKRRGAALALGIIGDSAAVPDLVQVLRDDSHLVRMTATQALGRLQDVEALPYLLKRLHDDQVAVQDMAGLALINFGTSSLPGLLGELKRTNELDQYTFLIDTIGKIDPKAHIPILIERLSAKALPIQHKSIETLGELKSEEAVKAIAKYVKDTQTIPGTEQSLGQIARQALVNIGTEEAQMVLNQLSNGKKPKKKPTKKSSGGSASDAKRRAAQSIRATKQPESNLSKAIQLLQNENVGTRRNAIKQLAQFTDDQKARHHILKHLTSDTVPAVRWEAVKALENFDGEAVVKGLSKAFNDSTVMVSRDAGLMLAKKGEQALPILLKGLADRYPERRMFAVEALRVLKHPDAVPKLIDALFDTAIVEDEPIARVAAKALHEINTPEARQALAEHWHEPLEGTVDANDEDKNPKLQKINHWLEQITGDNDFQTRRLAAKRLQKFAWKTHEDPVDLAVQTRLLDSLKGKLDRQAKVAIIEALGWLGNEKVTTDLMPYLNDKRWNVRLLTLQVLARHAEKNLLAIFLERLKDDPHANVRAGMADLLAEMDSEKQIVDALLDALRDSSLEVQYASITALGQLKAIEAVPQIIHLLSSDDLRIVVTVIETLGELQSASAVAHLKPFLQKRTLIPWQEEQGRELRLDEVTAKALETIGTVDAKLALEDWQIQQGASSSTSG